LGGVHSLADGIRFDGGAPGQPISKAKFAKTVKQVVRAAGILGSEGDDMRSDTHTTYHERILRVLVHIQERLDDDLPLDDLARVACFSPFHFHRVFTALVGESVKEHVRRLRLERAAYRLRYGDESVTRIAFDAGFQAHESFTRAFRALFGASPSQFRAAHRPPAPSRVHYRPDGKLTTFEPMKRGGNAMEVRIEDVPPRRVAFMRHVGPYEEVGKTWAKLSAWAASRGLVGPDTLLVGVPYDDPDVTPPDKLRYDACLTVAGPFEPEGEVGEQVVAGGECAVLRHRGPYRTIGEAYGRLYGDWLPASGREPAAAPSFVVGRVTPPETPPEELVTELYLPLKPV
jgi:AraC family transcriptional regulator